MKRIVAAILACCVVFALWGVLIAHLIDRKNANRKARVELARAALATEQGDHGKQ